jgi:DNA mismatch endonuclease Vsr
MAAKGRIAAIIGHYDPSAFPTALTYGRHVSIMPERGQQRKAPPRAPFEDVPEARRRNMAAIKSKNTAPELAVRRALHAVGYRYRLHDRQLPGCPDLAFPSRQAILFVHGCYWHRHPNCTEATIPKTRREWWEAKLSRNAVRDTANVAALEAAGWRVLVVWECEVRRALPSILRRIHGFLGPPPNCRFSSQQET